LKKPQSWRSPVALQGFLTVSAFIRNSSRFSPRRELLEGSTEIDWPYAEALAFGTLIFEGTPVRLSGQDSAREPSASATWYCVMWKRQ